MKIFHLITSLGGGGTENFLYQILAKSPPGFEHEVYFLGHDGTNGEKIRRLGISVKATRPFAFYRALKDQRPSVLHTCLYWGNQVGRVIGRAANVPFILSSQRAIDTWESLWHGIIDRWTLPLCSAILVNSDAAKKLMENRLGSRSHPPPIHKVTNGVDFELFKKRDAREARRSLGMPENAIIGGTLMRLHREKGAEKIPAFATSLLEKNPDLVLLIGGSGPMEARLKAQTRSLGERIRWLGWQDDPVRLISAIDFFWLLSREESFPQALLEASAAARPWVAPNVGGVHELLDAGASGILYPAHDLPAAITGVNNLLAGWTAYQEAAISAVTKLREQFTLDRMARDFYAVVGRGS